MQKIYWLVVLCFPLSVFSQDNPTKPVKKPRAPQDSTGVQIEGIPLEKHYAPRLPNSRWREVVSKFHFSFYTGLNYTQYRNDLSSYSIYQSGNETSILSASGVRYTNWISDAVKTNTPPNANAVILNSSQGKLGFLSNSFYIPLHASVTFNSELFRIGAGIELDVIKVGKFKPRSNGDKISTLSPVSSALIFKYFVTAQVPVYNAYKRQVLADVQLGMFSFMGGYQSLEKKSNPFINVGARFEKSLSDYFQVFLRPSIELKQYAIKTDIGAIKNTMHSVGVQVGFTFNLPELPKCILPDCKIQQNHSHGNKTYRSRVHPLYEEQSPEVGEMYHEVPLKRTYKKKR